MRRMPLTVWVSCQWPDASCGITGCMLNGDSLPEALDRAVHFINMGIKATFGYTHNPLDGMNQEKVLHYLNEPLPYYKYELVEN